MSEGQLSFVVLKADRPRLISVNFVMVGLEKVGVAEVKLQQRCLLFLSVYAGQSWKLEF